MFKNLFIIEPTDLTDICHNLKKLEVTNAHFTNGTFALKDELIVPTTLAGFKHSVQIQTELPIVVAVNSDESMKQIGKSNFESQTIRAMKVAEPLAQVFPANKIIILFYDEETPYNMYEELNKHGYTHTHHKWGYGTNGAPKIEGAEFFKYVYAHPMPNDIKPVCWNETPLANEPQNNIQVVDLRNNLIAADGVLFELPENLKKYQSSALSEEKNESISNYDDGILDAAKQLNCKPEKLQDAMNFMNNFGKFGELAKKFKGKVKVNTREEIYSETYKPASPSKNY